MTEKTLGVNGIDPARQGPRKNPQPQKPDRITPDRITQSKHPIEQSSSPPPQTAYKPHPPPP